MASPRIWPCTNWCSNYMLIRSTSDFPRISYVTPASLHQTTKWQGFRYHSLILLIVIVFIKCAGRLNGVRDGYWVRQDLQKGAASPILYDMHYLSYQNMWSRISLKDMFARNWSFELILLKNWLILSSSSLSLIQNIAKHWIL